MEYNNKSKKKKNNNNKSKMNKTALYKLKNMHRVYLVLMEKKNMKVKERNLLKK